MKTDTFSTRWKATLGLLAGLIAGLLFGLLLPPNLGWWLHLLISAGLGLLFGILIGPCIRTPGTGLIWGQAYGLLWWLFGSLTLVPLFSGQGLGWMTAKAQETLPLLLGDVVGFGAVLGVAYYALTWGSGNLGLIDLKEPERDRPPGRPRRQTIVPQLVRAVIVGGLGGLIGSWIFARGVETAMFFPLIAGLMESTAMSLGRFLHYAIGTTIGISFGLFFSRDIRAVGSSLVWGLDYGLVWWVLGPMTFLPILLGMETRPDWSLQAAQSKVPALVAHMLYGAILGLFYGLTNKIWRVLFVDSDPVNRAMESPGSRGLRNVLIGLGSGVIGGLLFTIVMLRTGSLIQIANLVGAQSAFTGFIVHLLIAIVVGITYGLLFEQQHHGYGASLIWATVYALWWWLLGAATLFPILLNQPVDWSLETVTGLYPSLIGHLLYGVGLGLVFQFLASRYKRAPSPHARRDRQRGYLQPGDGREPAPALWVVTLVLGVMLPLLLSVGI
jgi:uncharacterized membrane protein YagU involved in acid resistance